MTHRSPDDSLRTDRTTVQRILQRSEYDREAIYGVLDASFLCHVGFVQEEQPFVIPTVHVRINDHLYIHGSPASRLIRCAAAGARLCVTVTHLDGLVLARSAFHHSVNYRSVVVLGSGQTVREMDEKRLVLQSLTERVAPGRWRDVRHPSTKELQQTSVIAIEIKEASAKVRTGPPKDDPEDCALPIWAGVLPLNVRAGAPIPDPGLAAGMETPDYLLTWDARQHGS